MDLDRFIHQHDVQPPEQLAAFDRSPGVRGNPCKGGVNTGEGSNRLRRPEEAVAAERARGSVGGASSCCHDEEQPPPRPPHSIDQFLRPRWYPRTHAPTHTLISCAQDPAPVWIQHPSWKEFLVERRHPNSLLESSESYRGSKELATERASSSSIELAPSGQTARCSTRLA
jgi:hypothetical protein